MLGVIPEYNANIAVVIDLEENGAYCTAAEVFQRRTVDLDNRLIIHGSNLPEAILTGPLRISDMACP